MFVYLEVLVCTRALSTPGAMTAFWGYLLEAEMSELINSLRETFERHEERMKTDIRYALSYAYMQESTRPIERSKHYDIDGYCDSPYRGY